MQRRNRNSAGDTTNESADAATDFDIRHSLFHERELASA